MRAFAWLKVNALREGSAQHRLIVEAARQLGFETIDASSDETLRTILRGHGAEYHLTQGIIDEWVNDKGTELCDRKQLTKEMLNTLDIPHPLSFAFHDLNEVQPSWFTTRKQFVCKPEISTNGYGVTFDVTTPADVQSYLSKFGHIQGRHLLEEFLDGSDLRIQVIGGKMAAACVRKPAEIIGTG